MEPIVILLKKKTNKVSYVCAAADAATEWRKIEIISMGREKVCLTKCARVHETNTRVHSAASAHEGIFVDTSCTSGCDRMRISVSLSRKQTQTARPRRSGRVVVYGFQAEALRDDHLFGGAISAQ